MAEEDSRSCEVNSHVADFSKHLVPMALWQGQYACQYFQEAKFPVGGRDSIILTVSATHPRSTWQVDLLQSPWSIFLVRGTVLNYSHLTSMYHGLSPLSPRGGGGYLHPQKALRHVVGEYNPLSLFYYGGEFAPQEGGVLPRRLV